jgi:predicted exporter
MNIVASTYLRCSRTLLAILVVLAIACAWLSLRDGVRIDTDLKSLSPAITQDRAVNETLNDMSRLAANQFVLVMTHADDLVLEEASDSLREYIEAHGDVLTYVDQSDVLNDYLAQLTQYPFSFLTDQAQTALQTQSDQQLQRAALARLYGSGSTVRLIPLQQDPFGFNNDFALQAMTALGGQSSGEIESASIFDETVFYIPHNLTLVGNGLDMTAQERASATVKDLESTIQRDYPGIKFLHSGMFFFAADAAQNSKKDISLITTGSTIGVFFLVLLVFRSFKALILPALSIFSGTLFAFILCHTIFGSLHIFTLVFGASLIGVVIDYSLHFFYFHGQEHDASEPHLFRALLLSLFTTIIGYSALSWSGLAALTQIALFSGLGLLFAWLVVIALGPLLVKRITIHDAWLNRAVTCTLKRFAQISTPRWFGFALLVALLLAIIGRFEFSGDDSPRALFAPNPQLIQEERIVSALITGNEPGSFVVVRGNSSQEVFTRIEAIEQRLIAPHNKLIGVHNFFPAPENATTAHQLNQRLYGDRGIALAFMQEQNFSGEAIARLKNTYASGMPEWQSPADFFARHNDTLPPLWIENEERITTFLLLPKTIDLDALKSIAAELDGVTYISAIEETTAALKHLRHSALWLLLLAFGLIGTLMFLRFRSLRASFSVLVIPAISLISVILSLVALDIAMTLFHVMALFLVLGLGMDYVIFVKEMAADPEQTLSAVVLSAVTSLLSFGLLAASNLPAVSGFGLTVLIGNSLNLFGGLILASRQIRTHQTIMTKTL